MAEVRVCTPGRLKLYRRDMPHAACTHLAQFIEHRDSTGSLIACLAERPDIIALRSFRIMMSSSPAWDSPASLIFSIGFALQCYYVFGMTILATRLREHGSFSELRPLHMRDIWNDITSMLGELSVRGGQLLPYQLGVNALRNPSERQSGATRFLSLASSCAAWRSSATSMASFIQDHHAVRVQDLLSILRLLCFGRSSKWQPSLSRRVSLQSHRFKFFFPV
jgi:hypothetical protein